MIHSGQANAGHYYSLIKDIRTDHPSTFNKWFRFNDATVEPIELTEEMLEEECFGGTYRLKKEANNEERTRVWNAYLLIYRCIEKAKLFLPPSTPRLSARQRRRQNGNQRDSLSQLVDLVNQSEINELFPSGKPLIPSRVRNGVQEENFEFVKNRDTYCENYFQFIANLCQTCFDSSTNCSISYELCTNLVLHFLFSMYLRTHRRLRHIKLDTWLDLLNLLVNENSSSCSIFYRFLLNENHQILKSFLIDCPFDEIRHFTQVACENLFKAIFKHFQEKTDLNSMEKFIEVLSNFLEKNVVEQLKNSQSYFQLLFNLIQLDPRSIEFVFKFDLFQRLIHFLLGDNIETRRWNATQAKDFGLVHEILSTLALAYFNNHNGIVLDQHTYFRRFYFESESCRYLREICCGFQEIVSNPLTKTLLLLEKLSTNDFQFSQKLIRTIIVQANGNEFKSLFKLLEQILVSHRIDEKNKSKYFSFS